MNSEAAYFAERRHRMVDIDLRERGLRDRRMLAAMSRVPREEFVPDSLRDDAYEDRPLPIGFGQTISQPFTVAFMLEALSLCGGENVLEIGTGSGYAAAILSRLARVVHTVERVPELASEAESRLQRLGCDNVHVHQCDGTLGLPEYAPFDAIVVTAAAESLPPPLRDQLTVGGRIVIPIGDSGGQSLYRLTNSDDGLESEDLGGFAFVPLIGRYGRHETSDRRQDLSAWCDKHDQRTVDGGEPTKSSLQFQPEERRS
jgi:protein-L-isoaspartate(D-aspartate) O-methyltransferase